MTKEVINSHMMTDLWIVETEAKAQAIQQALGSQTRIWVIPDVLRTLARDSAEMVPESRLRAEDDGLAGQQQVLKSLRAAASATPMVTLATNPDQEGEALACYVRQILPKNRLVRRVVLDEITPAHIRDARQSPRPVDMALANAHAARNMFDHLVTTLVFPLLQPTPGGSPQALRLAEVAALRLVIDRERARAAFQAHRRWQLILQFEHSHHFFLAHLARPETIASEQEAADLAERVRAATYWRVEAVDTDVDTTFPPAPFTTSTLLQEAGRVWQLAPHQTMAIAERLYEHGLVTFPYTASAFVSPEAESRARQAIINDFGQPYTPTATPRYRSSQALQEARETIRPTDAANHPAWLASQSGTGELVEEDYALYDLIWLRFIASQMTPALHNRTTAIISGGDAGHPLPYTFLARSRVQSFPGFRRASPLRLDSREIDVAAHQASEHNSQLPPLCAGDAPTLNRVTTPQRISAPPECYTLARLVASLEATGIARPATYAAILKTLFDREYLRLEQEFVMPTPRGEHTLDYLVSGYDNLFGVLVAAEVETLLDQVAVGERSIQDVVELFYKHRIQPAVRAASATRMRQETLQGGES